LNAEIDFGDTVETGGHKLDSADPPLANLGGRFAKRKSA